MNISAKVIKYGRILDAGNERVRKEYDMERDVNQKLIFKKSQNLLVSKVRASTHLKIPPRFLLFCI